MVGQILTAKRPGAKGYLLLPWTWHIVVSGARYKVTQFSNIYGFTLTPCDKKGNETGKELTFSRTQMGKYFD